MTMMIWSETYGIMLLSLTLVHLMLLIERLKICQCGIFSRKFVRLPTAILILTLLSQGLLEIHLLTVHRILRLGEKALQGQVGVLSHGSSGRSSRGGSASRIGRGSRGGAACRGGRGGSTSQRPTTMSTANAPNARTMSEL